MRGSGVGVALTGAVAFWCATSVVSAQDQQLGARTKAMGGSYTAFEDDPVSIWLNPAGISTQPSQGTIAYQTYTAYSRGQETGPNDTIVSTVEAETVPGSPSFWPSYLGFVFQLGDPDHPFSIGICYARPYLLQYSLAQTTSANQTSFLPEAEVKESLSRYRVAVAKDFIFTPRGEPGFFTHLSVGLAFDIAVEDWEFDGPQGDEEDTTAALGGGLGLLVGLYDGGDAFRLNLGIAYQSAARFSFEIETDVLPAFDMPQQLNAGIVFYLLPETPLRVTFDFQWIDWSETAEDPVFEGYPRFEDAINLSFGVEFRIRASQVVNLYPRVGFRRFDAPWDDADDLPATGRYRLVLETEDEVFNIFTAGLGVGWTSPEGRGRSVDVAFDSGGDAFNAAIGFTYEF
jgi:hypothetical protein